MARAVRRVAVNEWAEHSVEARLGRIETELAIIRALQAAGLKIPQSILILIWAMLLATVGAIAFVVRLDARITENTARGAEMRAELDHHTELPWHGAIGERVGHLEVELDRLEDRLRKVERGPQR